MQMGFKVLLQFTIQNYVHVKLTQCFILYFKSEIKSAEIFCYNILDSEILE
jgi:hypothetical protein